MRYGFGDLYLVSLWVIWNKQRSISDLRIGWYQAYQAPPSLSIRGEKEGERVEGKKTALIKPLSDLKHLKKCTLQKKTLLNVHLLAVCIRAH